MSQPRWRIAAGIGLFGAFAVAALMLWQTGLLAQALVSRLKVCYETPPPRETSSFWGQKAGRNFETTLIHWEG